MNSFVRTISWLTIVGLFCLSERDKTPLYELPRRSVTFGRASTDTISDIGFKNIGLAGFTHLIVVRKVTNS